MPNFELSDDHRDSLNRCVVTLCQARIQVVEQNFPLKHRQIASAILPDNMRPHFEALQKLGAESLRKTSDPMVLVKHERIARDVCVHITNLNPSVWFAFEATDSWDAGVNAVKRPEKATDVRLQLSFNALDEDTGEKLIAWVNKALKEHRQAELTRVVVKDFLDRAGCGKTVASVITRWPALKLLFDEMQARGFNTQRSTNTWPERVRMVPAARERWAWPWSGPDADWYKAHKRIMEVCDQMLVGASMLPRNRYGAVEIAEKGIKGSIKGWRRLAGEKI